MRTDHVNVTGMELAFDYRENVMYAKACRSEHISVNRTGHGLIMGNWWEPIVPRFETPIEFPHIATEYSKTTIACRLRKLRAQKSRKKCMHMALGRRCSAVSENGRSFSGRENAMICIR